MTAIEATGVEQASLSTVSTETVVPAHLVTNLRAMFTLGIVGKGMRKCVGGARHAPETLAALPLITGAARYYTCTDTVGRGGGGDETRGRGGRDITVTESDSPAIVYSCRLQAHFWKPSLQIRSRD